MTRFNLTTKLTQNNSGKCLKTTQETIVTVPIPIIAKGLMAMKSNTDTRHTQTRIFILLLCISLIKNINNLNLNI